MPSASSKHKTYLIGPESYIAGKLCP